MIWVSCSECVCIFHDLQGARLGKARQGKANLFESLIPQHVFTWGTCSEFVCIYHDLQGARLGKAKARQIFWKAVYFLNICLHERLAQNLFVSIMICKAKASQISLKSSLIAQHLFKWLAHNLYLSIMYFHVFCSGCLIVLLLRKPVVSMELND
jgi:hypothetical protein